MLSLGLVLVALFCSPSKAGEGAVFPLQQDTSAPDLGAEMHAFLDDGRGLSRVVRAFVAGQFDADFAAVAGEGAPYQPIWLAIRVTNTAPDDGRGLDEWIPEVRTYGIVGAELSLIRADGLTETLLRHSIRRPFAASNYSGLRLRGEAVRLAPGETALFVAKMVFGPVARPYIGLLTPPDHGDAVFTDSIGVAVWYAFMVASLLFHFGFSLSMRSRVGVAYGVTLTLALVFIAYLDGFLFRFLYPAEPQRHLPVGIMMLLLTSAAGFAATALSIRDLSAQGRGEVLCIAGMIASGLTVIAVPFQSPEIMANVAYAAFLAMLVAQALAAPQWTRVFGMPRLVLRGLTITLAAMVALLLGLVLAGHAPHWITVEWQIKTLFAITAVWTIAALSLGLVSMRRDHERTLKRELRVISERERVAQDLLESERNYSHARALADGRRARLASASHDFRQPIASLRLTLAELGDRLDPVQRERLEDAFDYMDDISSDLLDETGIAEAQEGSAAQPYPLSLILDTVSAMFGKEAAAKGLSFRVVASSRFTDAPPLVLTRIVGNLVSNAVKYTAAGSVLVGVRSGGTGRAQIIVADTGPGLSDEELDRFAQAYVKGETSTGAGLGLAICHDLAAQNDLELTARARPGKGTCFAIDVPLAKAPDQSAPER